MGGSMGVPTVRVRERRSVDEDEDDAEAVRDVADFAVEAGEVEPGTAVIARSAIVGVSSRPMVPEDGEGGEGVVVPGASRRGRARLAERGHDGAGRPRAESWGTGDLQVLPGLTRAGGRARDGTKEPRGEEEV